MSPHKAKAAEVLIESLKLVVTISTVFFAAFLAFHASANRAGGSFFFYGTLAAFALTAVLSVFNINTLINKFNNDEKDLVSDRTVRWTNAIVIFTFFTGFVFATFFLSESPNRMPAIGETSTTITDSSITIGTDVKASVTIRKHENGRLEEVRIN